LFIVFHQYSLAILAKLESARSATMLAVLALLAVLTNENLRKLINTLEYFQEMEQESLTLTSKSNIQDLEHYSKLHLYCWTIPI